MSSKRASALWKSAVAVGGATWFRTTRSIGEECASKVGCCDRKMSGLTAETPIVAGPSFARSAAFWVMRKGTSAALGVRGDLVIGLNGYGLLSGAVDSEPCRSLNLERL